MSTTIRIDEAVYDALKQRAEPFVDTPNTVLRRLLGLPENIDGAPSEGASTNRRAADRSSKSPLRATKRNARKRVRAPKGALLPEEEYEMPLLQILDSHGGSAQTRDVLNQLGEILGSKLTSTDRDRVGSGGVRWRQRAQFVRLRLVEAGDMMANSPRGLWQISDQGRSRVKEARGAD